jgi:hypothetical protein
MRRSIGELVIEILFNRQVEDTEEARKSPTFRYQRRQNKLVAVSGLLFLGIATLCVWGAASQSLAAGITLAFAFLVLIHTRALAAASDAIFDSLFERINLQSTWLHVRLNQIESNTEKDGKLKSQQRWQRNFTDFKTDDRHYYDSPEWYKSIDGEP